MFIWLLIIIAAAFTFITTYFLRKILISRNVLVIPNDRSSHQEPKPQGGGLSIVICFILFLLLSHSMGFIEDKILFALGVPGLLIGLIGLKDDFNSINPLPRLIIHFLSASLGLYLVGGFPPIPIFGTQVNLGFIGQILAIFYIVWVVNLYNFMDGIDGLASLEAIFIFSSLAVFISLISVNSDIFLILTFLVGSVLGFLLLNFPKSYIFIGDVGSGFLGIILALISILVSTEVPQLFWTFLVLIGAFVVDSTYTLVFRIVSGKKFYEAHSEHLYQKISRLFNSHVKTSVLILAVNLFWLLPIAYLVTFQKLEGILGVMLAYIPLILACYSYNTVKEKK